jgi:DEAD/DEAH box helicase
VPKFLVGYMHQLHSCRQIAPVPANPVFTCHRPAPGFFQLHFNVLDVGSWAIVGLIPHSVWEVALPKRRDVLAVAQPGSGKTLAYLLTLAARIMGAPAAVAAGGSKAATNGGGQAAAAGDDGAAVAAEQPCSDLPEGPPAPRGLVLVPTRSVISGVPSICRVHAVRLYRQLVQQLVQQSAVCFVVIRADACRLLVLETSMSFHQTVY